MLTRGGRSEVAEEGDDRVELLQAPSGHRVTRRGGEHGQAMGVGEQPEAEEDRGDGEHALVHRVRPEAGEVGTGTSPTVTRVAGGAEGGAPRTSSAPFDPPRG